MRILVLTNMYPPHAYGGYEQLCQDVVTRWRAAGHQVLVLTSTVRVPGVDDGPEPPDDVRRQLGIYWADHEIVNPPLRVRYRMEHANRKALDAAVEDFAPDVVSAWAMGAMSLGALGTVARRGLPVVSVLCDEWPCYAPEVDAWMRPLRTHRRLARVVGLLTGLEVDLPPLDSAGTGCFISQFLLDTVRERSPWSFPDATVVYAGIKTEEFPFVEAGDDAFGWRLLYVGRIDPRKGIETVVHALAECPESATLAVVGGGDDRHLSELRAVAASLGLEDRVRFSSSPRGVGRRHARGRRTGLPLGVGRAVRPGPAGGHVSRASRPGHTRGRRRRVSRRRCELPAVSSGGHRRPGGRVAQAGRRSAVAGPAGRRRSSHRRRARRGPLGRRAGELASPLFGRRKLPRPDARRLPSSVVGPG